MNKTIWKIKNFDELSTSELYKIIQARIDVFVVEQNAPYRDLDDTDQVAIHIWAENEQGQLLAYCRVFDHGVKYAETSIGRVLSTSSARGTGVGKQLVDYAVQTIENRFHTTAIRISAQDYLIPFYSNYGFVATDKKYLEDNLPHTEMYRP